MAITSTAFGSVRLTKEDAQKFERQVRYGRPPVAASKSAEEGRALVAAFMAGNGQLTGQVKAKK